VASVEDRKLARSVCACARLANLARGNHHRLCIIHSAQCFKACPLDFGTGRLSSWSAKPLTSFLVSVPSPWTKMTPRDASDNNLMTQSRCNWAEAANRGREQLIPPPWMLPPSAGMTFHPRHRQRRRRATIHLMQPRRRKSRPAQRPLSPLQHRSNQLTILQAIFRWQSLHSLETILRWQAIQALFLGTFLLHCQAIQCLELLHSGYIRPPHHCRRRHHRTTPERAGHFPSVWANR
jgi:hypothetical protein